MELAPGTELEAGLRVNEDLGPGRGWLGHHGEDIVRVLPAWASAPPRPEAPAHPRELLPRGQGTGEGAPWVAYPFRKRSLADRLEVSGPLPLLEALTLGVDLVEVLQAQLEAGRRHGGLTPAVLYLDEEERLLVGGLEVDLGPEAYAGYRAPEHRDRAPGEAPSLVYAAGAVLYAALVGAPPEGPGPAGPSTRNPQVPAWIDRVVTMALELDPNHRYRTLSTFRAALGAAMQAIRLRQRQQGDSGVSATRPPPLRAAGACGGPMSPLGRRRPGGLRPLPPAEAAPEVGPVVQDQPGMGEHPEAIGEAWPRDVAPPPPRYRFSWRRTLTRGLPGILALGLVVGWLWLWLRSLL